MFVVLMSVYWTSDRLQEESMSLEVITANFVNSSVHWKLCGIGTGSS